MDWRILVDFIRQSMLKLPTHSGFHDLFLKHKSSSESNLFSTTNSRIIYIIAKEELPTVNKLTNQQMN
jgi:hypothetical protein